MDTLHDLAVKYGTDKADHQYTPWYATHFRFLPDKFSLIEIGVLKGASLNMWADYFLDARIIGVDINLSAFEEDGVKGEFETIQGDAGDPEFWKTFPIPHNLMVVIDDGSHQAAHIMETFKWLSPKLRSGGWYVIEDLATQYDPEFGGNGEGSPVTHLIGQLLLPECLRSWGWSEMHIHGQICFLRKA